MMHVYPDMGSKSSSKCLLRLFSTIVKPILNKIRGMRCIIYPGIALVGPGLQAPMLINTCTEPQESVTYHKLCKLYTRESPSYLPPVLWLFDWPSCTCTGTQVAKQDYQGRSHLSHTVAYFEYLLDLKVDTNHMCSPLY